MPTNTDLNLVVEALRARAEQRQRAGTLLSTKLAEQRAAGGDVRAGAVKVIDELDAANRLGQLADQLETGATEITGGLTAAIMTAPIPLSVVVRNPPSAVAVQNAATVAAGEQRTAPSAPSEEDLEAAVALVQATDAGLDGKLEDLDGLEVDMLAEDTGSGASDLGAVLAALDAADPALAAREAGV